MNLEQIVSTAFLTLSFVLCVLNPGWPAVATVALAVSLFCFVMHQRERKDPNDFQDQLEKLKSRVEGMILNRSLGR